MPLQISALFEVSEHCRGLHIGVAGLLPGE
jgi:hypothetical protein